MTHQQQDDLLRKHFQSTSKDELINRLMEFAPDHYRKTIELIYASPEEKQVDFTNVRKEIKELDIRAYPTYELTDQMILLALTKLRPFWKLYPTDVLTVYRDLAVRMHQAIEDGALYDRMEDVYMETGWPSEVLDFLDQLDDEQHQAAIKELATVRESLEWISAAYVVDEANR